MEKYFFFATITVLPWPVSVLTILEREPVVDYLTFLWSDYPTDYPISDT